MYYARFVKKDLQEFRLISRWQKKTIPLTLTYTLEELRSDETYNIRVMARNVGGAGKPSNEVSAKTKKTPSKFFYP